MLCYQRFWFRHDDELDELLDGAVKALDAKAGSSTVTSDDLDSLRKLATAVNDIRAEKADRIEAAQKAAAEIEQLAASVRGDDGEEEVVASKETEEPSPSRPRSPRRSPSRPPRSSSSAPRPLPRQRPPAARAAPGPQPAPGDHRFGRRPRLPAGPAP